MNLQCWGASFFIEAQVVKGVIMDDSSQPLPGVSIVVKGTSMTIKIGDAVIEYSKD